MPQRYKIFYTSTAERDITEKLMYIMQQYRDSVDEIHSYVHIRSVCTRGRNLDLHLSEQSESIE